MKDPTTTILHLSDTHLGEDFNDTGSAQKADGLSTGTLASLRKSYGFVMQTHDSYIIPCLKNEIRMAAQFMGAPKNEFDLHVITGDISTDFSPPQRFKFARDYFLGSVPYLERPDGETHQIGLNLKKDTVVCVPGNHDKLGQVDNNAYLTSFSDLPAKPTYFKEFTSHSGQRLLVYGLDSNLYTRGNIAVGKIAPLTLKTLSELFSDTQVRRDESAIRILVLHHHPADLNRFRGRSFKTLFGLMDVGSFSTLQEGDRLLTLCRGNVDLIMHGHEHFPIAFFDELANAVILSAGTSSSFQANKHHKNSFHAVALKRREFQIVQFNWNGARFLPVKEWTGNFDQPEKLSMEILDD